jgi:hypothetical protein
MSVVVMVEAPMRESGTAGVARIDDRDDRAEAVMDGASVMAPTSWQRCYCRIGFEPSSFSQD